MKKVTARNAVLTRIRIATGQCDDGVDFRKCRKITLVGIRFGTGRCMTSQTVAKSCSWALGVVGVDAISWMQRKRHYPDLL